MGCLFSLFRKKDNTKKTVKNTEKSPLTPQCDDISQDNSNSGESNENLSNNSTETLPKCLNGGRKKRQAPLPPAESNKKMIRSESIENVQAKGEILNEEYSQIYDMCTKEENQESKIEFPKDDEQGGIIVGCMIEDEQAVIKNEFTIEETQKNKVEVPTVNVQEIISESTQNKNQRIKDNKISGEVLQDEKQEMKSESNTNQDKKEFTIEDGNGTKYESVKNDNKNTEKEIGCQDIKKECINVNNQQTKYEFEQVNKTCIKRMESNDSTLTQMILDKLNKLRNQIEFISKQSIDGNDMRKEITTTLDELTAIELSLNPEVVSNRSKLYNKLKASFGFHEELPNPTKPADEDEIRTLTLIRLERFQEKLKATLSGEGEKNKTKREMMEKLFVDVHSVKTKRPKEAFHRDALIVSLREELKKP